MSLNLGQKDTASTTPVTQPSPNFRISSPGQDVLSNATVIASTAATSVDLNPNNFVFSARETDIIDDEDDETVEVSKDEGACGGITPRKFISPFDDPLLSEDIMSCISALDDVIAEFDDPSLPYIYEDEVLPQTGNPSQSQIVPSSLGEAGKYFSTEDNDKLVLKNEKANHTSQSVVSEKSRSSNKATPPSHHPHPSQSHLIQIPVFSKSSKNSPATNKSSNSDGVGEHQEPHLSLKEKVTISTQPPSTPSSLSSKLPGKPSVVPRTFPNDTGPNNSKVSKSGVGCSSTSTGVVGGTYSKGTNQEILLLPRIPSSSPTDKSSVGSSSRNSNLHVEPIYSSVGKSRPQLSLGMYIDGHHHSHPPQEPEIDYYNDDQDAAGQTSSTRVYNAKENNGHEQLSGSGRLSKSSSNCGATTETQSPVKELWNFPSEKNLPRSLRKTRKTCFLEDSKNSEGEKASSVYNESDGEGHSSVGGQSSTSEQEPRPTKLQKHHNGRNSKVDDNRKIYEDIVRSSSSENGGACGKGNLNLQKQRQHQPSDISLDGNITSPTTPPFQNAPVFTSFNNSSSSAGLDSDAPMPKPRARQQIPKVDELSPVKYPPPPGKIPKPNPKPGVTTNHQANTGPGLQHSSSSPFSPMQCENSRTEESGKVASTMVVKNLNNNATSPTSTSVNVGNGNSGGNMMRMMMMMKGSTPNSKNNSTGSASSISRSSSSSSGGDYRKDNLSSSSGVVVTTNSSVTTSSPTHSVNNNSFPVNNNNNVTIIHADDVKVKGEGLRDAKSSGIGGDTSVGLGQRVHSIGNKSSKMSNQAHHQQKQKQGKPATTTTVVLNNGVLEVDDGYLSMINRNEAPLLWPEEFIENETFSPDELKRLSVHLPEEDEGDSSPHESSDSCPIELEIVDYEQEPSRRQPGSQPHGPSSQPSHSQHRHHVATEKAEYFSDDSLEGDREEQLAKNFQKKKKKSSVSSYLYSTPNNGNVALLSANSSPSRHYHRQQIVVNTALVSPIRMQNQSQVSRIPKMIGGASGKKSGSTSSSPDVKEKLPKRKPCSFFVSLTDEGMTEVNSSQTPSVKSSSLPMGSKLGAVLSVSPVKSSSENNKSPLTPTPTSSTADENKSTTTPAPLYNRTGSNNTSAQKLVANGTSSNLPQPQLRYTKSINTGGPRCGSSTSPTNNNNANKRKSTSDLVTVVALNNPTESLTEQLPPDQTTKTPSPTSKTHVFNRTSTFLIPSPTCSRTDGTGLVAEVTNQLKRPRDDETDNDEDDDFSSDFDILGSTDLLETEPDSLQPLSLTDVNDFVSEIMDTALRQQIKQTQMARNNYPMPDSDTNSSLTKKSRQDPVETLPPATTSCDNDNDDHSDDGGRVVQTSAHDDGEERARVALQIEAVVSTFLSDNQSFLGRGESEEDELHGEKEEDKPSVPLSGEDFNEYNDEKKKATVSPIKDVLQGTVQLQPGTEGESSEKVTPSTMTESANISETTPPPMVISTPIPSLTPGTFRDSSLVGEENILDDVSSSENEEDSEEQPPAFIPTPPPHHLLTPLAESSPMMMSQKSFQPGFINTNGNLHNLHNSNVRDGKAALDILAERINNSKKFNSSPADDQFQVSQFIHDKRNIWAMYDRPFDEDLLTVNNGAGVRGYASRSQENLMDAMTKERFQKSFNSRGQSSTLPLNCRPPSSQRRSSTFRNMFNKFRKSKQPSGSVIKEIPEYRDDEVSITSKETGPSEPGKKRGFFSRLFRRSRKN